MHKAKLLETYVRKWDSLVFSDSLQSSLAVDPPAASKPLDAIDYDVEAKTQQDLLSDEIFCDDYKFLTCANMLVPLDSYEAASCSRAKTLEYIPVHIHDPYIHSATSPCLYNQLSGELKELSDEEDVYKDSSCDCLPEVLMSLDNLISYKCNSIL